MSQNDLVLSHSALMRTRGKAKTNWNLILFHRFSSSQGKASFLIQKLFGKLIVSERRVVESYHDEVPPASNSHSMLALVLNQEAKFDHAFRHEKKKGSDSAKVSL